MPDDHTCSNAEVEALARRKGISLPEPTQTDPSEMQVQLEQIQAPQL